jgi:hypothetical protein
MWIVLVSTLLSVACFGQGPENAHGTWKWNAARSTISGGAPFRSLTVRIEPHPKGEVFTLDRTGNDGRTTSSSMVLYFDGEPRRFDDFGCSGIQSSRRTDERTVEIVRMCASGAWMRFLRRASPQWKQLVLEVTEERPDGRRVEQRLVLEKR